MVLDLLMLSEPELLLEGQENSNGNGYRLGRVFEYGTELLLYISRDR